MNSKVLSFDSDRVNFVSSESGEIIKVKKKSSYLECVQMLLATDHLAKNKIILQDKFLLRVAPVLSWDDDSSILITEYCDGVNLEVALRNRNTDFDRLISMFVDVFSEFKRIGFLWGDFAPRNMILNEQQGVISIVDFERKLNLAHSSVTDDIFSRYVKSYSREEFSSFLLKIEQDTLFSQFLVNERNSLINIDDINSNRKKKLMKLMFGKKDCYGLDEVNQVEDLMVFVATPFFIKGEIFYPMDYLDRLSSSLGQNFYVQLVNKLARLDEYDRYRELEGL